jgi:hypothetical protein
MTLLDYFSPKFLRRYLRVDHDHAPEVVVVINIVFVGFFLILCNILLKLATVNPLVREVSEEPSYTAHVTLLCVKLNKGIRNN